MSFLKNVTKISAPKVHTVDHDFGGDDGVQSVCILELTYRQRADLFQKRFKKGADGTMELDMTSAEGGLHLNAELLAATICDEKGKRALQTAAVLEWKPDLVDSLATLVMKTLKIMPDKDADPDPSTATN